MVTFSAIYFAAAAVAAAQTSPATSWRVLPLTSEGKVHPAWAHMGWGEFTVDQGALRTDCDERGMGLLFYTREKFGDAQIRIVYRSEKPQSNSGVFVRIDDGVLGRIGEKSPEVRRNGNTKLAPEMIARLQEASAKQL